jgi:hypothetical protein
MTGPRLVFSNITEQWNGKKILRLIELLEFRECPTGADSADLGTEDAESGRACYRHWVFWL